MASLQRSEMFIAPGNPGIFAPEERDVDSARFTSVVRSRGGTEVD